MGNVHAQNDTRIILNLIPFQLVNVKNKNKIVIPD